MSNVIQFLETQGRHPACINTSMEDFARVIASLNVDEQQRKALLQRDASELNRLLDGRAKMYCVIVPPDGDEQGSTPDDADGDGVPDDEEQESAKK